MDENKILEGYNLLREKQILESAVNELGANEMSNTQILVPKRVYDKLRSKRCEQHIIKSGKNGCAFRSLGNDYCW